DRSHRLTPPVAIASTVLAALVIIALLIAVHRNEQRLETDAERARPGPRHTYQPKASTARAPRQTVRLSDSPQEESDPARYAECTLQTIPAGSEDRTEPEKENAHGPEYVHKV